MLPVVKFDKSRELFYGSLRGTFKFNVHESVGVLSEKSVKKMNFILLGFNGLSRKSKRLYLWKKRW